MVTSPCVTISKKIKQFFMQLKENAYRRLRVEKVLDIKKASDSFCFSRMSGYFVCCFMNSPLFHVFKENINAFIQALLINESKQMRHHCKLSVFRNKCCGTRLKNCFSYFNILSDLHLFILSS